MVIDVLQITDAEMEIMKLIWQANEPLTAADINESLPDRHWSLSTVHTLAMRLESRGILKYYKIGRKNYYLPYISEFEYKFIALKSAQNLLCGGSLAEMLEILLTDMELTSTELAKVKELIGAAVLPSSLFSADVEEDIEASEGYDEPEGVDFGVQELIVIQSVDIKRLLLDYMVVKEHVLGGSRRGYDVVLFDSA